MNPETEVSDLLLILMPPARLRIWLHKVFEDKRGKGQEMPDDFVKWLGVVDRVCSDLPSEVDGITPEQWQWIERRIFANRPQSVQRRLEEVYQVSAR
jgi:hypothetical protein